MQKVKQPDARHEEEQRLDQLKERDNAQKGIGGRFLAHGLALNLPEYGEKSKNPDETCLGSFEAIRYHHADAHRAPGQVKPGLQPERTLAVGAL
jgi:hypothetical protein